MPNSSTVFDDHIMALVEKIKPASVLDIGAGRGKYGKLLRRRFGDTIRVDALEIDRSYPDAFDLLKTYDAVLAESAVGFFDVYNRSTLVYDLIIAGDVLQDIKKSDGVDCLHEWVCHAPDVIVVVPMDICQLFEDGHETFRSCWGPVDFEYWLSDVRVDEIKDGGRFDGCRILCAHIPSCAKEVHHARK